MILVLVAAFAGCPADDGVAASGGADNPVTAGLVEYCKPMCLRYQECNLAVFNVKWGTLDACETECNPFTKVSACNAQCDTAHASDAVARLKCMDTCGSEVSLDSCNAMCDQISESTAHASCLVDCTQGFSQACADVRAGIRDCYLKLKCERAVIYKGFGGSASDLGECANDNGVNTSC